MLSVKRDAYTFSNENYGAFEKHKLCQRNCRRECEYTKIKHHSYETELSPLFKQVLISGAKEVAPWVSDDEILNTSLYTFYYGSNVYQVQEQVERITVDTLISKIGGIMGIWAGMSLITIVQLVEYTFYIFVDWTMSLRAGKANE